VISDDDERVLCDQLFHTDVAEAANARLPSVAWLTRGMTTLVVDDDRLATDVDWLLRPETAQKRDTRVPRREGTGNGVPLTGSLSAQAPVTSEDCRAMVSCGRADGSRISAVRPH